MGARVLYGLAAQGWIHGIFGRIHKTSRVPALATVVVTLAITTLALAFPLLRLAELTSLFILLVFVSVNGSLLVVKRRGRTNPHHREVSRWIPICGMASTIGMLVSAILFIR